MEHKTEARPLLSIVIATRNRIPYAISAIESILESLDDRLELVVQDNSDSRELESYVRENFRDRRLCYGYIAPPLSSIDNFNAALGLATGEYLCLMGDDDGVNPEIIEAASWAKRNSVDSVAVKNTAVYLWKGVPVRRGVFTKTVDGALSVATFRGRMTKVDTETALRRLVRNGGPSYLECGLPKLYHGFVHRRCLQAIRERTGSYLGGLSPDIFSSVAIACVANNVVVTDYPLTIPGACRESSSAMEGRLGQHSTRLEDAPHLRNRSEYSWDDLVPRVYTAEAIVAESGIAALRAMGRHDLVRQFSLPRLAACCIGAHRGVTAAVLRGLFAALRTRGERPALGALAFGWSVLACAGARFARRASNRLMLILGVRAIRRVEGLVNIVEASHALTAYLKENGWSFADGRPSSRVPAKMDAAV